MHHLIKLAAKVAAKGDTLRTFRVGAVGIRNDGVVVSARNGAVRFDGMQHVTKFVFREAHAESRLARKLDRGATIFVARIGGDGKLAMSRPCKHCETALRRAGVKVVYYSINGSEYGVWRL